MVSAQESASHNFRKNIIQEASDKKKNKHFWAYVNNTGFSELIRAFVIV